MNRWRPLKWLWLSLACFAVVFCIWRLGEKRPAQNPASPVASNPSTVPNVATAPAPKPLIMESSYTTHSSTAPVVGLSATNVVTVKHTNVFAYRLNNTTKTVGELSKNRHALLLENALIDSDSSQALAIPDELKSQGDPGAYIVQARGQSTEALRASLMSAGASIVSYIPNTAYLVRCSAETAQTLGQYANVTPWEPYFKVKTALMPTALAGSGVAAANLAVFSDALEETKAALDKMGVTVVSESRSPFGVQLAVRNVSSIASVAGLPGVEEVEPSLARIAANDLTRVIMSDATNTITATNYLNLTGTNVLVAVADSWVPTNGATQFNPDLLNIIGPPSIFPVGIADLAGHATHVGGIIGGSGLHSPTNAMGSLPNANFRGKAPASKLLALPALSPLLTDAQLQQAAAQTNALISNNSWGYAASDYNLAAANYDQAVRDSLPGATGSQPLIYVFAAGNNGQGDDGGLSGAPDTLLSPAVAKNVISVGASELPRGITNNIAQCDSCNDSNTPVCITNQPWAGMTDSKDQVASFSSRGNVGIGVEGDFGRFKPDLVAPGTFVVSTRSLTWDTNAYNNPVTVDTKTFVNQAMDTNQFFSYSVFVPCDSVQLTISATALRPQNTHLPLYVKVNDFPNPPGADFLGTDFVSLPPDAPLSQVNTLWYYSVGNPTNVPVLFNTTSEVTRTNELGNYFPVLQGLNNSLGSSNSTTPLYRYEFGTSMAAPAVSGTLALMEDYFTNTLKYTPSPALMKALLINGARSLNSRYDFQVTNDMNFQGWGLVNLTNSIPLGFTNAPTATGTPTLFWDQSPTNSLATGDSRTFFVNVSSNAQTEPLRITLVWTDPPGNPAAGIKLVNDLDLVVTNRDGSTNQPVFFGNAFGPGIVFSSQWNGDTNNLPRDNVNNVENVYIPALLGSNYSITVIARDVNVNAVTAHTNGVVQDFALVISSANGDFTNALTLASGAFGPTNYAANLTAITNQFADSPDTSGGLLLGQRAGASSPLEGTNTLSLTNQPSWNTNGQITIGVSNQWHFYVITNAMGSNALTTFTNAAFVTFLPVNLAVTPLGVDAPDIGAATRPEADIDLYVARGPTAWGLTNLDPTVIAGADKSLNRGGTEVIIYSNAAPDEVFYIGVKAEDQEAAEYGIAALFSENPFSQMGPNGEEYLHGINVPTIIPDGSISKPGIATTIALAVQPIEVRRVVVTNFVTHENFGDLVGSLTHSQIPVFLNNHSFGSGVTNLELIYEDNGEGDVPGSQHTDGPGTLQDFTGQQGIGVWLLQESDNALFNTGRVDNIFIRLDPQEGTNGVVATIQPNSFFYDFIDVPPNATNLTVFVDFLPPSVGPVQLYVRYADFPTQGVFDYTKVINSPGDSLTVNRADLPPLRPGRYYVGIFNPTTLPQTVRLRWTLGLDPNGVIPTPITTPNPNTPILDDAVTNDTIFITNNQNIVTVNVGVVINHPRISDLDLTLISPEGQRILLFENRGGPSATNMGHLNITTNFFGTQSAGDFNANTNVIGPITNSGVLIIDYNFFTVPDTIDVYYDGVDIFSSGLVSNPGSIPATFVIPYGPGASTNITIVMNKGNNDEIGTMWTYTPRVVSQDFTYLTFTDDTNVTQLPIKFAIPPYDAQNNGTNFILNDFEQATAGLYVAPTNIFDLSGGWNLTTNDVFVATNYFAGTNLLSMASNMVSVVTDPATAANGSNFLALARGSVSRTIPLNSGKNYTINYVYRGPGIAGWWRGEGNANDSADPEFLGNNGSLIGRFNFPAGEVGQAFAMEDSGLAFQFAGTNTYVQVRQSPSLDVGEGSGFTVEGWINPTNTTFQQPLVEWLARVPTNKVVGGRSISNLVIEAGPFLNRANGHYYYLLGPTNWTTSELWANSLGGHLAEIDDANEQNWVYDTFAQFGVATNYTMWIGLTNGTVNPDFIWSSGVSNIVYTNWSLGQPTNCPTAHFTAIQGPTNALPGLWTLLDNNGLTCGGSPTNKPFGIVEVNEIQTNGVQFWISVTNAATPGNGRLYANIVDTNSVSHEIFSPPGLIQSNVFQHVALTYNTNTGVAMLYYAGTNVATTNLGVFVPKTGGDVLLGKDMSRITNNFFWGRMDEMSIYSRFLSPAEILAIYRTSASTTNRNIGKFDPSITPSESLAEAQVVFNGTTNIIFGHNSDWQVQGFTLTASSNSVPLQITGLEPGILLDSFNVSEHPPGNLYYLPEQPLQALVGSNAFGNWTLEIRDARTGTVSTNATLVSWQLQFILETNTTAPLVLNPQTPGTNTVPPGQIAYFSVDVPSWANFATNILVSATAPVDLLFNQNTPPGTGDPGDFIFVNNGTVGSQTLSANPPLSTPPLLRGQHYYLGVRNNGTVPSTVVVQVNFDITTLTNGIPISSVLRSNDVERPFVFNVSTNAIEATFQLLKLNGNADLVLRKGLPLPNLLSADYGSFGGSNADETIYVLTNSLPVRLSPGPWYLDVFKRDSAADATASNTVRYAVLAKELIQPPGPTIINLTNRVPLNFTAGPGTAFTNFFKFSVTNFPLTAVSNVGVRFELFNQTGNGDLTVQTNAAPLAPPFLQSSRLPGNNGEIILIHTNSAMTNLVADWYLGVPNNETNPISFTILAQIDTNGIAAFPTAEGSGASTRGGGGVSGTNVYHVITLADSGVGSLRDAVTQTNGAETVIFDVFGTINLLSPLYITNSFLTIAGQTAPGDGITVAGAATYVQDAHDLILRYLRFRPTAATIGDSLQFTNVSNVIVDHISAAYGTNDVISVLNSSNVTVQWSVVAESLNRTNIASGGSEIRYGSGDVTLHHNLYADNYSGNPTIGEDVSLDFVNNVIYNWGIFSGFSTNDLLNNLGGLTNFLNYSANYLIAGSNSVFTNMAFWSGTSNTWIFQTNNFIDTNQNTILDGANTSWGMFSNQFTEFSHPFAIPPTAPDEAFIAYERVLDFVGNSMFKRDAFDRGIVQRVRTLPLGTSGTPLLSGMTAWWKAEGNAIDSVNANNGALVGPVGFTNGEVNQAFDFDGAATYVQVPDSPSLHFTNVMTVEAWVNLKDFNGRPNEILSKYAGGSASQNSYTFSIDSTDQKAYFDAVATNYSATGQVRSSTAIPTGQWVHLAGVCDGTSLKMYVNGQLSSSVPWTFGVFPGNQPLSIGCTLQPGPTSFFNGQIDEVSLYNRALSSCEILDIYNAGSAGKQSLLSASTNSVSSSTPYADVDRDGIPDFWEITLSEQPTNFSPNLDRDGDGYTDLEEYDNWLGVPHALTVTNTTTNVDLYIMSGNTGNLLFGVANGTNGSVYLTNTSPCLVSGAGNIAVFTPTNNFGNGTNCGFASFNYMVTNTDTMAYFGPVTVSVFVSAVPITNVAPYTNIIVFTNPPNISVNESNLLTVTNTATESVTNLTLTYTISTIINSNATSLNGWPLTNLTLIPSPVIDPVTGVITWTPTETQGPGVYTITTVVTDNGVPSKSATNTFDVTVNEVNLAPFWPPNIPSQTNYTVLALTTLTVTNTATDVDIPENPLSYMLLNPPAGATIDTNGVFTWTPLLSQAPNIYIITTVVTDTNAYATNSLSATNTFTVTVTVPLPPLAFTQPAQAVTGASAQLNGMATPDGLPTVAWFEWGTNTLYGNQTPAVSVGNSFNVVYTKSIITGLVTNVPYHFRLVVSNVVAVTKGFDQILDEAKVVVWGADYVKQAEVPPGLSNVVAIAGAYDHSLALRNNGTVIAWGDNTFTQTNVPVGLNNVLAVAGGQYSSMALKNGGTVVAWGGNILSVTNVPPGLNSVVMIAGGTYASLALQNSGNIVTWGANFFGVTNVPVGLTNVVEVAGGSYHSLAIRNDGTVVAWGDNSAGQTNVPSNATNIVAIAGGNYHSLALRYDGTVVAWGDNSSGQTNVPAGLSNVVAVAAGGFHSLALKSDGTVVGWGDNTAGQAGIPAGLSNVVAISSGYFHSLALTPTLLSTNPIILPITNGVPATNTVFSGSTIYYRVDVPSNADAATNTLLFTVNGPLNIWYSTNVPPTVGVTNDFLLITNSVTGTSVVDTATSPQLNPGTTYYLGIQNTNLFAVSYAVQVDFHLVPTLPSTNAPPISTIIQTNIGGTNGFLLIWFAPTNDLFKVQWSSGLPPVWNTFTNIVGYHTFIDPTNSEFEFFDDGSQTGGLSSPRFYNLILLNSGTVTPLTNGVPVTNTVAPGSVSFYQVNVPGDVNYATNILLTASLPLNLWFSTNVPPTVTNVTDFHLLTNSTGGLFTSVAGSVGPPFFVPGTTYYLGVQNTNTVAVTYGIGVGFHVIPTSPITNAVPISTVTQTNRNGTNGFLLVWFAPTNELFQVQWSPGLPASWNTFTNIVGYHTFINPTNSEFEFFDDGSQTGGFTSGRFYQLILLNSGTVTPPLPILTNGVPVASNVAPGAVNFYQVNVPTNVDFSTNLLLSGSLPLNVWFSTNVPPTITNATDFLLITNTTSGSFTSGSGSGAPPSFVPGTTYYLGVQNPNIAAATYTIEVNFHVVTTTSPVTNAIPISTVTQTNINGTNGFLMVWFAPTNDLFQVQWSPGLPASWSTFTNIVGYHTFINPTNSEFEFFDDGSQTGGFASGRFYQLILLNSGTVTLPPPILTNGIPVTSNAAPGAVNFYQVNVPTNVDFSTNFLLSGSAPLNVWFSTNVPPTITNATDFLLITNTTSGSFTSGSGSGAPPSFVPGTTYYLGVQNTNIAAATYSIEVNFHFVTTTSPVTNAIPISTVTHTNINGTNGFLMVWFAPTNDLFQVQWSPGLPVNWNTFTNIVTYHTFINPTNSEFEFFDDGSQTGGFASGRFYQLILLGSTPVVTNSPSTNSPSTNTIPISTVTTTNIGGTNNFFLVWFAPSNDLFQVQWSPGLLSSWTTFTNIVHYHTNINSTTAEFEFLDDGSQTGGFGSGRFYRLILLNGSASPSVVVIPLTNGVPLNFTTGVGSTNFFSFDITQTNAAVLFELYNLNGNGDLIAQRSNLPVAPPYTSVNLGTNSEQIVIRTNSGPANLNAISWFLGVPNRGSSPVSYTIRAVVPTNGILISGLPFSEAASQVGSSNMQFTWGPTVDGEKYEIRTNGSLGSTNWGALTDIVAVGTSQSFTDHISSTGSSLFYRIMQVP